jgi:hypothetical protein
MKHYHALRQLKEDHTFGQGDVLVLFGELFSRGYANGLVEEAEKRGMKIIRTTVGRRERDNSLRSLTPEEAASIPQPFINLPMEAGFDLETGSSGKSPVDLLKDVKLTDWQQATVDKETIFEARKKGRSRFQNNLKTYLQKLEEQIPKNANVVFAHLMAGGVPRAKIVMPLMNRAFKGTGERYVSSQAFWESNIGELCALSFLEVTAETFNQLISESTALRERVQSRGKKVCYSAYGYHGTEILIHQDYTWQTYTPYLQGWAKMRLEEYSREWTAKGVSCCVYNCPEILTNSSSIFQGVEVSLYPLMSALQKENPSAQKFLQSCQQKLKSGFSIDKVLQIAQDFLSDKETREHCQFDKWPQHSCKSQMERMLAASDQIFEMHVNSKDLITNVLSELVFAVCGKIMLNDLAQPEAPVSWINHDIIAKTKIS